MSILRGNKTFLSIMACLFLILCAFFITRQYMYDVDAEDGLPDGSFATMAQAGAQYFNNRLSGLTGENDETYVNFSTFGNAAGVIGYIDPKNAGTQTFAATNTQGNTVWDFRGIDPSAKDESGSSGDTILRKHS